MVKYTHIINETTNNILTRLELISKPPSNKIKVDLIIINPEYHVVKDGYGKYILYVSYPKLGWSGTSSQYKTKFSLSPLGEITEVNGIIQPKWVVVAFYAFISLMFALLLKNDNVGYQFDEMIFTLLQFLTVSFLCFAIEYFIYKKKLNKFFLLLELRPPPEVVDKHPNTV